MDLRSPNFSLRDFSESVKTLDVLEILDAGLQEIHAIKMQCHQLGFGYKPRKGGKARKYYDDLHVLVSLYAGTRPDFREGYIEEAGAMLTKLSQYLIALQDVKLNETLIDRE